MNRKTVTVERVEPRPFGEHTLDELWTLRCQAKDEEERACGARHDVEAELFQRFDEAGASRLRLSTGEHIDLIPPSPHYDARSVAELGQYLIEMGLASEAEWRAVVRWEPKVDARKLRAYAKLGRDVAERIEATIAGRTGRPQLKLGGEKA